MLIYTYMSVGLARMIIMQRIGELADAFPFWQRIKWTGRPAMCENHIHKCTVCSTLFYDPDGVQYFCHKCRTLACFQCIKTYHVCGKYLCGMHQRVYERCRKVACSDCTTSRGPIAKNHVGSRCLDF